MRIERWYWLLAFCLFSVLLHLTVGLYSGSLMKKPSLPQVTYMDVELEKPEVKPEPKPEPPKPDPPKPEVTKKIETRPTPSVAKVRAEKPLQTTKAPAPVPESTQPDP